MKKGERRNLTFRRNHASILPSPLNTFHEPSDVFMVSMPKFNPLRISTKQVREYNHPRKRVGHAIRVVLIMIITNPRKNNNNKAIAYAFPITSPSRSSSFFPSRVLVATTCSPSPGAVPVQQTLPSKQDPTIQHGKYPSLVSQRQNRQIYAVPLFSAHRTFVQKT